MARRYTCNWAQALTLLTDIQAIIPAKSNTVFVGDLPITLSEQEFTDYRDKLQAFVHAESWEYNGLVIDFDNLEESEIIKLEPQEIEPEADSEEAG